MPEIGSSERARGATRATAVLVAAVLLAGLPDSARGDDAAAIAGGVITAIAVTFVCAATAWMRNGNPADDPYARRLMVGETFSPPGSWSSFPPHKHDGLDGEPRLEEVYHFRVDPPGGFGIQRLYTSAGEDVSLTVEDGDAVLIPYGYHPVAVPPGYRLYYLWALAGDERRLALHEDPRHRWIHGAPSS